MLPPNTQELITGGQTDTAVTLEGVERVAELRRGDGAGDRHLDDVVVGLFMDLDHGVPLH